MEFVSSIHLLLSPWGLFAALAACLLSFVGLFGQGKFFNVALLNNVLIRRGSPENTVLRPDVFQNFPLERKTVVSHNVAIYRFALPSPDCTLGLPLGQHISIGARVIQLDGSSKDMVRSYTPISDAEQRGHFDLLIKTYPQGNISQHVASLSLGQSIQVRGPKGAFAYRPNIARKIGMIAGGTGIAPMMQIIRAVVKGRTDGDRTEVSLVLANVTLQDILLKEQLDGFAAKDDKFHVHYVLDSPPMGWTGGIGYVTAEMITKWLPKPEEDVKILLCGPPPMIAGLKKTLTALGFDKPNAVSKAKDQVFAF